MKKNINTAFTLVELIVVITILAVLATVAFISFQGYTSSSRDSVRLADLKNISKSFEINRTKDIDFPLPDKKVDISASGTIFQYQWELSQNILETDLNIFDGGLDPVTLKPYGYAVNLARNKFQVIWFLENQESVANISTTTTFADNSDKYIKSSGDSLGILLNETTNEVIVQSGSFDEIDVENDSDNYLLYINKLNRISGISYKTVLKYNNLSTKTSCKEILENDNTTLNQNGYYMIDYKWYNTLVYCDMTTQGWWWTLFYANSANENMKVKKSYLQYLSDKNWINYNWVTYNDYDLYGMLDVSEFWATAILTKELINWIGDNWASVTFNNSDLLNKFINNTIIDETPLSIGVNNDCQLLPNNQSFIYKTNNIEYSYNKITHRVWWWNNFHWYWWRDCMVADWIIPTQSDDPELTKPKDYPRHYFYKIDSNIDVDRVRWISGFNKWDSSAIARYFVR